MANYTVTDSDLTSIANAIRTKGGTQASLEYPTEFISAINAIPTGSSTEIDSLSVTQNGTYTAQSGHAYSPVTVSVPQTQIDSLPVTQNGTYTAASGHAYSPVTVNVPPMPIEEKQVNFIDYDGTLLYSYTKAEINAMTSESDLPANPTHTGLTAQGWNWTLAQIKAQLTAVPDGPVWVGQLYITSSGKTEIDVTFTDPARLAPIMWFYVYGTITVDWGDNSTPVTVSGSNFTTRVGAPLHTYPSVGSYTITIQKATPTTEWRFGTGTNSYFIFMPSSSASTNQYAAVYTNCITAVRLGEGIDSITGYAFAYCGSLQTITIPSGIGFGSYAFYSATSLQAIVIPSSVTLINSSVFESARNLMWISLPSSITNIYSSAFSQCYSLQDITIPNGITSINSSTFYHCYTLYSITLPNTVTSIGSDAFRNCLNLYSITMSNSVTNIGTYAFYNCKNLHFCTLPNTLTSLGKYAFYECNSLVSITLSTELTILDEYVLYNCFSLGSLTVPSKVTSIKARALYGPKGLAALHMKPTSPPTAENYWLDTLNSECIIYVPYSEDHSILSAYQAANRWSTYASKMQEESQ